MEPQMSKNTEFQSEGPPGPEQNMKSSETTQGQSQSQGEVNSTSDPHSQNAESRPEAATTPPEVHQELNGEESYYFTLNPYLQQYYTQYAHMYHVLNKSLSTMNSELRHLDRSVNKLANGVKECSDTMGFYVTRMLSLQKETLYALDKTNSSLKSAVQLLSEIKEYKEERAQGSCNTIRHTEREKGSEMSDGANIRQEEKENRHRSRSRDRSTQRRKRYYEK